MNSQRAVAISVLLFTLIVPAALLGEPPKDVQLATAETAAATSLLSPLVIRIDQSILEPLQSQDVDQKGRVDQVVLGTRAIGESHTIGKIDVAKMADRDDGAFTVKFTGQTATRTTGYNGPAIIYSRTHTDFVCTREVTFDPVKGFIAAPCQLQARTTLTYEGFGSSRSGLGSRLIARIAHRRADDAHAAAHQIAARDNREEIRKAFDDRLDRQLIAINKELAVVRYAAAILRPNSPPRLAARTCSGCILIGLAEEGSSRQLQAELPPNKEAAAMEVWLHPSLLGDQATLLVGLIESFENRVAPAASPLLVADLQSQAMEDKIKLYDLKLCGGWIVVAFGESAARPMLMAEDESQPQTVASSRGQIPHR
jgi:hypothetical protein